jgi:hypothetical protein
MPTAGHYYYDRGKFTNNTYGNGYYWSSTPNNNLKAIYFFLRLSGTNPNNTNERLKGLPVRCLKNTTDAVTLYLNPNGGRVDNAIIDADAQ